MATTRDSVARQCARCGKDFFPIIYSEAYAAKRLKSDAPRMGKFCSIYCSRDRSARAQVRPTKVDLAWAAGFIEGEGSFSVHKVVKGKPYVYLTVTQVQREPLERLLRMFGGTIQQWQPKSNSKLISLWRVYGTRARGVAMTLYHWLSPRRRDQVLALLSA